MAMNWTAYFSEKLDEIMEDLQLFVRIETPTHNKVAVDALGEVITHKFARLGCTVETISQAEYGNQLRITYGKGEEQTLVLGHFDTVKEIGTLIQEPCQIIDGKLYGPGVYDMKAGIVFTYYALQAIIENQLPLRKKLVFFWNTDEEVGSPSSKLHIQKEASRSNSALVIEPAFGNGLLKTSRKGGGEFVLTVHGRAAHAGNDHASGVNAIEELSRHILDIQGWTNYELGTTLSVGKITGGTASNVIPELAEAMIDVRISKQSEAERINRLMAQLKPYHPDARLSISGGIDKMPMERTAGTEQLFLHAKEQARLEGLELGEIGVGGTSDGNFVSSVGTPVLDGLGPVGDGAHASHEHIVIDAIPSRIALLVRLFTTV
ncbi:M20 family metallopeptidase [Brevibacillus sp. SYSU BS000544]|uniref:M20 family metallopeptidase n=1 Tax=Brevibacillus sp. SYSU BS000544 TaxID=3416443 RepID=UPI003CE5AF93